MNVKAERIEHLIQGINRSLILAYSNQNCADQQAAEFRALHPTDAAIFGVDKFAFEIIHFIKSTKVLLGNSKVQKSADDLTTTWDQAFVSGLETLMVECSVVIDDLERDCFVSRVYCWFSEKLQERRRFPRGKEGESPLTPLAYSLGLSAVNSLCATFPMQWGQFRI
jgi:hypothetical protein